MMENPLIYAVSAMLLYAWWAFFAKLSTQFIPPEQSVIYTYGTAIVIALSYYIITDSMIEIVPKGIGFSLLAGLFIGLGTVSYYLALNSGSTVVSTSISGLYLVGTAILASTFLGDSLSTLNMVGICFAIGAIILLAQ